MGSKLRHLHVVYETPVSGLPESPDPKNVEGNGRERIEVWEVVVFVAQCDRHDLLQPTLFPVREKSQQKNRR